MNLSPIFTFLYFPNPFLSETKHSKLKFITMEDAFPIFSSMIFSEFLCAYIDSKSLENLDADGIVNALVLYTVHHSLRTLSSSPKINLMRGETGAYAPVEFHLLSGEIMTIRSVSIFDELLLVHASKATNDGHHDVQTAMLRLNPKEFVIIDEENHSSTLKSKCLEQMTFGTHKYNVNIHILKLRTLNVLLNPLIGKDNICAPCLHLIPPLCLQHISSFLSSVELSTMLGSVNHSLRVATHTNPFLWSALLQKDFGNISIPSHILSSSTQNAPAPMERYSLLWQHREQLKRESREIGQILQHTRSVWYIAWHQHIASLSRRRNPDLWLPRGGPGNQLGFEIPRHDFLRFDHW